MQIFAASVLDTVTVPAWSEFPWLVHAFSTRTGGVTTIYRPGDVGELNLGFTPADDRENVRLNRELFIVRVTGKGSDPPALKQLRGLVTLRQTHSAAMHRVGEAEMRDPGEAAGLEGDGLMTDAPGVLLGIQTADCVPVFVVDPVRRAVAAFHAGWRGTVKAIVEQGVARMVEEFGSRPNELMAAVGPAIGACCYRVGGEVREQFGRKFAYAEELFSTQTAKESVMGAGDGETLLCLDLAEANRRQLLAAGLHGAAITLTGACTSCCNDRFFSHRAEGGVTGRMLAVIGVRS